MAKVFADQSMSLDGFTAGANVGPDNGMGDGGEALHEWAFKEGIRPKVLEEHTDAGVTHITFRVRKPR